MIDNAAEPNAPLHIVRQDHRECEEHCRAGRTVTTMDDLKEQRAELDVSLGDVAEELATNHDLAASTLSSRIGEWERGDREPTDEDLDALSGALDAIEAEQNFEYPDCVVCGRTPQLDIDYVDDDPVCIICTYHDPDEEPRGVDV